MKPTYQPGDIESKIYQFWQEHDCFKPSGTGQPYCIILPPPNVTGSLHMGHGFQTTLMDAFIRYRRMCGDQVLWQPGMDHAGIATQMVVERQLAAQGTTKQDLGREAFIQKIWDWKEKSGGRIIHQLERMGASLDWSRLKFTLDDDVSTVVRKAFNDLYDEGLVYRGKRLVNWDPVLKTAISDLEVINIEEKGSLWYVRYPLVESDESLIVATTRPETMFGDTAVAVHPEDKRYQKWIGHKVHLPLTDRTIPIIADDYVDPQFGTGCLKITPAHDFNDYAIGIRHQLPRLNILTPEASLNDNVPPEYRGLTCEAARAKAIKQLQAANLLVRTEDHVLKIPHGDRTNAVIEPFLTDQWFVKTESLAAPAIEAVEQGHIRFIPENWTKTYFQWMRNIEDWCISRQLWWGHRIPAWYDDAGHIYVGRDEQHVREKYHLSREITLRQDEDVLDTWFSSALWPFSTLGWPEDTQALKTFYPTNILVTGFDIIFFWVARMIMFGLKFTGQVPFKELYITGLISDSEGQKMSKSKGNILDPLDLIDGISLDELVKKRIANLMQPQMFQKVEARTRAEFPEGISESGTDALRFTFCALASLGRNITFSVQRLEGYRNFCNKIWNATRYVLQRTESVPYHDIKDQKSSDFHVMNQWIFSRLNRVIQQTHEHYAHDRFDLLAQTLYDFTWHEYCDWYVELSKTVLNNAAISQHQKEQTIWTLVNVLENLLRLLHPLMPFITEALWQNIAPQQERPHQSIMMQPYPIFESKWINETVEMEMAWLQALVIAIRNIRGEVNIAPHKPIRLLLRKGKILDRERMQYHENLFKDLAHLASIEWLEEDQVVPASLSAFVGALELYIPLKGLVDREAEIKRLSKEQQKLENDIAKLQKKLDNPAFLDKAPPEIVAKDHALIADLQSQLIRINAQIKIISQI